MKKSSRYRLPALAAAFLGAMATGLLFLSPVSAKSDKDLFEIKTWTRKDCSVTPWTVADRLGFFAEEGIRLVETGETQTPLQIPSVIRGNNDVGSAHPNTLLVAIAGGAKLVGVVQGGIEPTDPAVPDYLRHMWWFVNPEKHPDVKSFADLKNLPGKIKISNITMNICTDFLTNILADKYGIPRDKLEWVTMPDVQAVQALRQGLVDIAPVHPPYYKALAEVGARKIADTFETGLGSTAGLTHYYFRADFVKKHPEEVAAFARAIVKAQRWANANPEKAAQLTEEAIGVPVLGNHYYSETHEITESLIVSWLEELEKNRVIPRGKLTPSDLVTHDISRINLQRAAAPQAAEPAVAGLR